MKKYNKAKEIRSGIRLNCPAEKIIESKKKSKVFTDILNGLLENFEPDYSLCTDERKEVWWNICKQSKKDNIMLCTITRKPCIAWKGYEHGK